MPKPTPGQILRVLVHPDSNNGHDELVAVLTGVNDDGSCNAVGYPDVPGQTVVDLQGIILADSRGAAEKELARHVKDMPGGKDPETNKPRVWEPVDVTPWVRVAYPLGSAAAPAAQPAEKTTEPAKKTTTAAAKKTAKKTSPVVTSAAT